MLMNIFRGPSLFLFLHCHAAHCALSFLTSTKGFICGESSLQCACQCELSFKELMGGQNGLLVKKKTDIAAFFDHKHTLYPQQEGKKAEAASMTRDHAKLKKPHLAELPFLTFSC